MATKFNEKIKKNWFMLATLSISAVILFVFLISNNGLETLAEIIAKLEVGWLIVALLSVAACWMLEGYVLHLIIQHVWKDKSWDYKKSYNIGMSGLLYSAITPSATGGQPMQVYAMHNMGINTGTACSAIAVKTLTYQIVMVLYALIMVVTKLKYFQTNVSNFSFITVIGIICNSIFIALVFLFMVSEKITDRILRWGLRMGCRMKICRKPEERYEKIHSQLELFHDASKVMGKSAKLYLTAAMLTAVQITLNSLIPFFIYRSFGLRGAHVSTMIAAQVFVSMVSAFVPLPGSSGGAEACFYIFFGPYFKNTIWAGVFLWRVLTYYFNILFGAISAYWDSRYTRRMKSGKI
jgi:hypothetical protein